MAVPKPMLTEFGIHYRLESCVLHSLGKLFHIQKLVPVQLRIALCTHKGRDNYSHIKEND